MPFISATASTLVSKGGGNGGYLSATKLGDGESMRLAILSEEPLESWTVWGENGDQKKPFRFISEPSQEEIAQELGDFTQRMNYEGTDIEKPKFSVTVFVWSYAEEKVMVWEVSQRTLIKELDKITQTDDYQDIWSWDLVVSRTGLKKSTEYGILPAPQKPALKPQINEAWAKAQADGYDLKQLLVGGSPFGQG